MLLRSADDNRRSADSDVGSATAPEPGLSDADYLLIASASVDDTSFVFVDTQSIAFQNACAWRNKKATEVASLLSSIACYFMT